jgi:hypothetical protein
MLTLPFDDDSAPLNDLPGLAPTMPAGQVRCRIVTNMHA